ncbi:MAG: hypothetical protein HC784_14100, partial [Hydrococcus sp. CSU_1_8]|nr:hypothetical protein [Hydrococcus sp. CSU_1_8]
MTNNTPTPEKFSEDNSGNLSALFNIDRNREKAVADPSLNEFDPNATIDREEAIEAEGKIPIYKNALLKTVIVVVVMTTVIGGAAGLYLQNSKIPIPTASTEKERPKAEFNDATVKESELKGEIALNKQQQQLKQNTEVKSLPNPSPTPIPTPATIAKTTPLKTATPTASISPIVDRPQNTYRPTNPVA